MGFQINTVTIVGLGSIGAMYASFLVKALGGDHVFCVADKERILRYRRDGVFVNGERLELTWRSPAEAEPTDLLIFATKIGGLREAAESARGACGENTLVLSFLNGITSETILEEILHPRRMLYAVVQGMDAVKEGNRITMSHVGFVAFGEPDGRESENTRAVAELFRRAGIDFIQPKDIRRHMYSKWMLNVGINQVCGAFGVGYGGVRDPGSLRDLYLGAMEEARACAAAEGVTLTEEDIQGWVTMIDGLDPLGEPSMRQDTKAGRPTEVSLFGETVLDIARRHGISVPINEMLVKRIREMENRKL